MGGGGGGAGLARTHAAPGCHRSPMSQHGGHTCDPSIREGEAEEQKFKIILG